MPPEEGQNIAESEAFAATLRDIAFLDDLTPDRVLHQFPELHTIVGAGKLLSNEQFAQIHRGNHYATALLLYYFTPNQTRELRFDTDNLSNMTRDEFCAAVLALRNHDVTSCESQMLSGMGINIPAGTNISPGTTPMHSENVCPTNRLIS